MTANERKRGKDEKELVQRYKVFAKLQTAQDFEVLCEGLICRFLSLHIRIVNVPR
jgi:transcriptional adapter 2-alpha